jgi:hypothetical protein
MQDFRMASSYMTFFWGKISKLEFSDFDLDGVIGVWLARLS